MYSAKMLELIKTVEATREERYKNEPNRLTADEKKALLNGYHPDYQDSGFGTIQVGKNKGEKAPIELVELLHANSRIKGIEFDFDTPKYDVDVLIIGGGGAGASAAIEAKKAGANVMIATKLRIGDANSTMAEGGIQAADKENDSPQQHYLDSMGGGHYANKPELLRRLVMDGPGAISWLENLGVMFDKELDGTMLSVSGGGISRKRLHACADYTGLEITRVLINEVRNLGVPIADYTAALELILDENGKVAGAVLMNMLTGEYVVAKAKTVIISTGGAGRMHYHGFPTTNHYGATADGLIMAYRVGASLLYQEAIQYHPTGVAYPTQLFGALVTEKVRSIGAQLVNIDGTAFVHPLETRDVVSSAIIRECGERGKGIPTPNGAGVWLDTPLIVKKSGASMIEQSIPGIMHMFQNYGIDIREVPILMYPTFHYQNGGIDIEAGGNTKEIENLFVAGEAIGGIHGRNRLLGNSMLDVVVFGRLAGKAAAEKAASVNLGKMSLKHIDDYAKTLEAAGIENDMVSPKLLPDYVRDLHKAYN
ncbi:MAG: FAD-binding protein [Defluviitaleaceae bacterium]|nr:FAD-binding protein [Defluviitaleaceae bacterium]